MKKMTCRAWTLAGGVAALSVLAPACGDTADSGGAGKTVTVTAADYKFEGLPKSMKTTTKLALTNTSTKEVHELVALRIPDAEKRPASELVKLPEAEQEALFPKGPPPLVLLAPPNGAAQITALGDGTLKEKGRYLVLCSIPTGADPAAYLKAVEAATDGPPDVPGGAPHLTQGMFGEIIVK